MPKSKNPIRICKNCQSAFHCKNNSSFCDDCRKPIQRECILCGKPLVWRLSLKSKGIFCSPSCGAKYRWSNAEQERVDRRPKCTTCGGGISRKAWNYTRKRENHFCSISCYAKYRSQKIFGAAHPRWKGGHDERRGGSWNSARKNARLRDKVCQHCGKTREENGQALDVHHIIPFRVFGIERYEEANHLSNLITLCIQCHKKAEKQTGY